MPGRCMADAWRMHGGRMADLPMPGRRMADLQMPGGRMANAWRTHGGPFELRHFRAKIHCTRNSITFYNMTELRFL